MKESDEILLDVSYRRITRGNEEFAEIELHTRNKQNRKRQIHRIEEYPYFYIDCNQKDLENIINSNNILNNWILHIKTVSRRRYHGGEVIELIKITGKQPWMVPTIRGIFENFHINYFEADIPFTHRYMIDNQLKGLSSLIKSRNEQNKFAYSSILANFEPIICSIDIEIEFGKDEEISFRELISDATRRITAIGLSHKARSELISKSFILKQNDDDSEISLLKEVCNYLWSTIDPDIIVTYNGDGFDWPYLVRRFEQLGLPKSHLSPSGEHTPRAPAYGNGWIIPGVLLYDLYHQTKWLYTEDGRKTLDSVAEKLLGTRKISLDLDHGELWRLSLHDNHYFEKFEKYVERDATITRRLYDVMSMNDWVEVIKICGAPPGEAINFTERQSGEFLVFQIMQKNNILIPPAPSSIERKQRKSSRQSAKGGLVIDPTRDIATSVLIADFASMYPSIIVAFNIGGESFKGPSPAPKNRFKQHPTTSMALMQNEMLSKRSEVKEKLYQFDGDENEKSKLVSYSKALKLVSNSTFGSYNYIGSRFYNYDIASTITQIGRDYLKELTEKASTYGEGYEAIYGDTDSVFIEMPLDEQVVQLWNTNREEIDISRDIPKVESLLDYLTENLPEELKLEFHDIAFRIIFHRGAKKRYAYVSALSKEVFIYGFESIRHDWSPFAKNVQQKAFDMILKTGDLKKTKQQIINYMQQQLDKDIGELKDILVTFGALKRHPDKYSIHTPAIGAYLHHVHTTGGDLDEDWRDIDYFPFLIIKGNGPQKDRARHPDHVLPHQIDKRHYIEEALRTVNRFNLGITMDEVRGIHYMDLRDFFES